MEFALPQTDGHVCNFITGDKGTIGGLEVVIDRARKTLRFGGREEISECSTVNHPTTVGLVIQGKQKIHLVVLPGGCGVYERTPSLPPTIFWLLIRLVDGHLPWIDRFGVTMHATAGRAPQNFQHRLHGLHEYGITCLLDALMMSGDPGWGWNAGLHDSWTLNGICLCAL